MEKDEEDQADTAVIGGMTMILSSWGPPDVSQDKHDMAIGYNHDLTQ